MKTRETTPGKTYSVHTSSGCTVSDKNGWQKTIVAPEGYFTSHAGEVTIDGDDAADIRELFNLAPYQKLRLLGVVGGNDGLPKGYTQVAYLESTGTQYIDTGYYVERGDVVRFTVQYIKFMNYGNGFEPYVIGNYSLHYQYILYCVSRTSQDGWTVVKKLSARYFHPKGITNYDKINVEWSENGLKENGVDVMLNGNIFTPSGAIVSLSIFKRHCADGSFSLTGAKAKFFSLSVTNAGKEMLRYVPVLTADGPAFYDVVNRQTFYNSGTGAFIAGIDTQAQLNNMLRKLPDRTGQDVGTLQVRLAEALQTPENEAKLDSMLAKNWEISQAS